MLTDNMEESDVDNKSKVILIGDDVTLSYLYCCCSVMNSNKLIIYASSVPPPVQLSAGWLKTEPRYHSKQRKWKLKRR
jgi:hypothetical protein